MVRGKQVSGRLYVHELALQLLETPLRKMVEAALNACSEATNANVFKIDCDAATVSVLEYPDFFEAPFPVLHQAWHIRLADGYVSYRSYAESNNPPILHRKELLLPPDHPKYDEFAALTVQAESLGLFEDNHLIGFSRAWEQRIARAGYQVCGHQLLPLGNDIRDEGDDEYCDESLIARHRTALSRSGLSAPVQALLRDQLLNPSAIFFDYGCGRGDDIRYLQSNGISAHGWDPHYAPDAPQLTADVVNLGFVVNVIEDFDERVTALRNAFKLARQVLAVAVMLYGNTPPPGQPYRDGYRTQRNTFQKYFTQNELKEFVETALDTEAVPVGPGILFVFADKMAEQNFLFERQCGRRRLLPIPVQRSPRLRKSSPPRVRISRLETLLDEHQSTIEALWAQWLEQGRSPEPDEFAEHTALCGVFGSWRRVLRIVLATHPTEKLEQAAAQRRNDLLVFFALRLFARKKPYRQFTPSLQRDIKAHFGDYATALNTAQLVLHEVAQPNLLDDDARKASQLGLGYYVDSDYLQLETALVFRLSARLRIYVGCASLLYGDLNDIDLVKIHLRSGKLSLFKFDDFYGKPLPLITERIKIRLRDLDIDFFHYSENLRPLYFKSRYMNEESPKYAEQLAFDEAVESLKLFDPDTYGPSMAEIETMLSNQRLMFRGFSVLPAQDIPDLDKHCGANFLFRDLIECGETWERTGIENRPKQAESYNALHALAINLLDPIIDYFGMIRLTYGFASTALTRKISARIAPTLDQHASCEVNRLGNLICPRKGAAVDFIVEDEDMFEVARWIAVHLPFDRIYLYGRNRPLHISYGPENVRQITLMQPVQSQGNRYYPRTLSVAAFEKFVCSDKCDF